MCQSSSIRFSRSFHRLVAFADSVLGLRAVFVAIPHQKLFLVIFLVIFLVKMFSNLFGNRVFMVHVMVNLVVISRLKHFMVNLIY